MSGESWLWIGLLAFLILCCVLPMLFMRKRDQGSTNDGNGQNHSQRKP